MLAEAQNQILTNTLLSNLSEFVAAYEYVRLCRCQQFLHACL